MTTIERLFALATAYADAAVWADRERAFARSVTKKAEQDTAITAVEKADSAVEAARAALRADLRHALELPVYAVPDPQLPGCTWKRGHVVVHARTDNSGRAVRIRYTPDEALATGAALIAFAALTDERFGGTFANILGTIAASETSPLTPTGPDTPHSGRRA